MKTLPNTPQTPRTLALASLLSCEKNGRYVNLEIQSALAHTTLNDADKGLYTALVYGVTERAVTLDYIISLYASRPPAEMDTETRTALRIGIYQLTFMNRIPAHAAVSETVSAVGAKSRGFVNAVLRSYLRADCKWDLPTDTPLHRLSVECGTPEPLCAFFAERYGEETTRKILTEIANPDVTLRVNPLKTDTRTLLEQYKAENAMPCPLADDMITVHGAAALGDGLKAGLFFVQDSASRLCVKALAPQAGEFIIDTCSAPGGKTLSCALDMGNQGRILAMDLHENKLSLIRRSAEALGVTVVETAARDARTPHPDFIGKADAVLCDAPCSGLGVLGKKPDIRYKSLTDIAGLPAIQYEILCGAAQYVRTGGRLVYSTCTLNPDENEKNVSRFLDEHKDFTLTPFSLGSAGTSEGMRTFFPHTDGCDGFFIAKMTRKGNGQ